MARNSIFLNQVKKRRNKCKPAREGNCDWGSRDCKHQNKYNFRSVRHKENKKNTLSMQGISVQIPKMDFSRVSAACAEVTV